MSLNLQIFLWVGTIGLFLTIYYLLKKGMLSVKYSLLWLCFAVVMLVFAIFPYSVFVLRDLLNMVMPSNLVFMLLFCFVLLLLLSQSIAISQLAEKSKRLTQASALLEKRLRALEETLNHSDEHTPQNKG